MAMAPTLKEIDAVVSVAAAPLPATAAAISAKSERVRISNESSSSGMPTDGHVSAGAVPPPALAANSPPLQLQQIATSSAPTKQLITQIERENPNGIPPDESAFLIEPHFSRHNPFHRHLSNLDLAMRCAICSELYHAPVTLIPCMHAFCSLCVRNHFKSTLTGMKRKVDCPKCNEPVRMPGSSDYEKGILPNKQLEQLVDAYTHCRDQMRESLVRLDLLEKEKALGMDNAAGRHKVVREVGKEKESRSSKRVRTMVQKAYSSDSDFDEDDGADDAFACKIPTSRLGVVKQTVPQQGQHQLKRKPTVNYHGLKKQKLAELCRKEGLDTHGNDTELKKRHSDFITLYNSECDSAHPRSVGQLREEIRNKEMAIMREAGRDTGYQSACMRNLASSLESRREGDNTIPTSRDAAFDAKMNNNFAEMIAALKKRKETGASSSSTNPTDTVEQKVGGDNEQAKVVDLDTAIQDMSTSKVATVDEHSSNSAEAIEDRVSSASYPVGAKMAVKQVGEHYVEPLKSVHNVMPPTYPQQQPMVCSSALANSKLLAGTPKLAVRQSTNGENTFATGHETPMLVYPTPTPKYRYTTKPTSVSRISSLGPWVCPACTFNNVRNTAKKARCEMCNSVRPVELGSGKWSAGEVVNIDC